MREPAWVTRLQVALAFHRWKKHAETLSAGIEKQERQAVLDACRRGHREIQAYAYQPPELKSDYRQYLYLTDQISDEEVDTDNLTPKKDEFSYDRADEAMPDLTTSGDNVHMGAAVAEAPMLTDEEREKLEAELKQVENDVSVLQDVLHNKLERLQTIRRTLGLETNQNVFRNSIYRLRDSGAFKKTSETVHGVSEKITNSEVYQKTSGKLHEWKDGVQHSETYQKTSEKIYEWKDGVQQSEAYQKTGEALKTAGEKTKETLTTVGATMSRKLGDMRNSNAFKSFEGKMGNAYTSVKENVSSMGGYGTSKMSGSRSEDDIGNVQLPEQKVPM